MGRKTKVGNHQQGLGTSNKNLEMAMKAWEHTTKAWKRHRRLRNQEQGLGNVDNENSSNTDIKFDIKFDFSNITPRFTIGIEQDH